MREIQIPKTANPEQILETIEKITGGATRYKELKECESQIIAGKLLVPFSIRHNYLPDICDLLHLWQTMKQTSRKYVQYQLAFSDSSYKLKDIDYLLRRTPLIDEISLMMLNDLDLLPLLFDVFKEVIITKGTIGRLVNWSQKPISFHSNIAERITNILKMKISQIIQPSCKYGDSLHFDINDLIEYGNVLKKKSNCIFYSDDGLARVILYNREYESKGMTTIDFLEILRFKGILSDTEVAKKYAKLCAWNTTGVYIKYIDILRLISSETKKALSVEEYLQALYKNQYFNDIIKGIWNKGKQYNHCLRDIASLISMSLEDSQVKLENNLISALWIYWNFLVYLKINSTSKHKFTSIAEAFCLTAFIVSISNKKEAHIILFSRLWAIYKAVTNEIFPKAMVTDIDYYSIKIIAQQIALLKFDSKIVKHLYNFVSSGLDILPSNALIFRKEFKNTFYNRLF